jgi:hypothetical protein
MSVLVMVDGKSHETVRVYEDWWQSLDDPNVFIHIEQFKLISPLYPTYQELTRSSKPVIKVGI